jgi:phosphosulfolactate synthase (CoM biosynthesis protein A)
VEEFRFRSGEFRKNAQLQLRQGGRVLYQKRLGHLHANTSLRLVSDWVEKVDFSGEPVKLVVQA